MPERPDEDFEEAWSRIVEDLRADDSPDPSRVEDVTAFRTEAVDPGAFVDTWSDEGHFEPPPPPDLPEGTPVKRLAWAGLLGGPATLLLVALGWQAPRVVGIAAGLVTLAGFVTLIWQLPDAREDAGWDDGAQL